MFKVSAGLIMYRRVGDGLQVLLVHPGGPLWRNKDAGAWSIPKGETREGEDLLAAAKREFHEETGITPTEPFIALTPIRQKSGKIVHAWAFEGDCDPARIVSSSFSMVWPPRSGQKMEFPEVDRAEWCSLSVAEKKINPAQVPLLEELKLKLTDMARL
ncbi:MAG: NUDIX domain-containing protein [Verrucomicrobiae bacterium]|nr:NUDIX domain-containing protein [Verrucomicrobiae bacterium]